MRLLIAAILAVGAMAGVAGAAADKPNIILLLVDDMGTPGVGCYGGIYKTPKIDALAAGGIRFERCFSAPLCGPSRAQIMSGRYPFRTGVLTNGNGAAIKPDSVSIAKVLKDAGYATAEAGKWSQLTYMDTAAEAAAWGFDEFLRWDKREGERYWRPALNRNGTAQPTTPSTYGPDAFHEFVVDFIRRHRDTPFFIYYPTTLIHGPIVRTPDSKQAKGDFYADNIAYLDKLVGKLVSALDELELREKTLIVFTGDNGSTRGHTQINGRAVDGSKGTLLEGGSRVPLIVNWKGTAPAGRVVSDLVQFTDFYATFAELAGAKLPAGVKLDSRSFTSQLRGEKGSPREWVFLQLGNDWYARNDNWKLTKSGELFDMSGSPFVQKRVGAEGQGAEAAAARQNLQSVLDELKPAGGVRAKDKVPKKERRRKKAK